MGRGGGTLESMVLVVGCELGSLVENRCVEGNM